MNLIEIDGSQGEGGGQILRTSVSLSCILGIPVRISKIRAGRKEPGLKPQHLQAVTSAAKITNSKIKGAQVGSTEIEFIPGSLPRSFSGRIDTGTAGSVTLIAQTLIPIAIFNGSDLDVEIVGGTEVPASPTIDYLQKMVLPVYKKVGGKVEIDLIQRGYYPRGGGIIKVSVRGSESKPHPINFPKKTDDMLELNILAASRAIPDHVATREIEAASLKLTNAGFRKIKSEIDSGGKSYSPGNSILIYCQNDSCYVGALSLGERGKRSEEVGSEVAEAFLDESKERPNVDSHLADMLVTLASCAPGGSFYSTPRVTSHLETNLAVAKLFTGSNYQIAKSRDRGLYEIELSGLKETISQ